jgi:very-short-patch-repair endonuclease
MSVKLKPEQVVESIIAELGLKFEKEFRFAIPRRWRFDYRIINPQKPELKLSLEINGSCFTQGRHTRGVGYSNDLEKINTAQILGWTVLQYTTQQIEREPQRIYKDLQFVKERGKQ